VEILWTTGAFPVEEATAKFFFRNPAFIVARTALCARFRPALRLNAPQ
jgi:hypothetical protein